MGQLVETVPDLFGGIPTDWGAEVKCPACQEHTPDAWRSLEDIDDPRSPSGYSLDSMRCGNSKCRQLIVRAHHLNFKMDGGIPFQKRETWIVIPRNAERVRRIDALVDERWHRDYNEATALLDISPRMSAVLSRRLLGDLLEEYAGKKQFSLADRIDSFNKETQHPSGIRANLHHLREIADLSAHTKKDDQAQIIEVDLPEAEWTLDLIDRLFDYLIVAPKKDELMRTTVDDKLKQANRRPIAPLPDDRP